MGIAPYTVAGLAGLAVLLLFTAIWVLSQERDPVEERLDEYGLGSRQSSGIGQAADPLSRYRQRGIRRVFTLFGLGPRLALALTRADMPLTAAEFSLVVMGLAVLGLVLGTLRYSLILGGALAVAFAVVPFVVMRIRQRRRLRRFTHQLPDTLTLLIGALRAGHGLNQSFDLITERLPPPMSTELADIVRAVNLGVPFPRALEDAVARIGSEDFNLVVVAINVQYETGGNLAETLETIGQTVRDRLRMLNEIRVLTAQQRFTGYVLAFLPVFVGLVIFFINPEYMSELFEPGWVRILPIGAVVLQLVGFYVISRIVDIEV